MTHVWILIISRSQLCYTTLWTLKPKMYITKQHAMYHSFIKTRHVPYTCLFQTASAASHLRTVKWHIHIPALTTRAYFSVYYYTKCVLLKAGRATLKTKMCNIKLVTQTIAHIIWCKTVADALKINVLNTKTSSALGGLRPLTSTGGSAPDPGYRLALPRSSSVCVLLKILRIGPVDNHWHIFLTYFAVFGKSYS